MPERCITSLTPHEPHLVHVYDGRDMFRLRVTGIPSQFCPGSLMFLFERLEETEKEVELSLRTVTSLLYSPQVEKRILYTGDFRFDDPRTPLGSLPCLQSLHREGVPLELDELYLDTTFCSLAFPAFPARKNAEEKMWEICQRWVRRNGMFREGNPHHVVLLELSSTTGYESLLQMIHHRSLTKWKVHVSEEEESLSLLTSDWTSSDPSKAPWLHACGRRRGPSCLPCQRGQFQVCLLTPGATFFTKQRMAELEAAGQDPGIAVSEGGSSYRVCYSNHPSLRETESFVKYFSPHLITPLALPHRSVKDSAHIILQSSHHRQVQ